MSRELERCEGSLGGRISMVMRAERWIVSLIPIRLGTKRKMFSSVWSAGTTRAGALGLPLLWLTFLSAAMAAVCEVYGLWAV